MAIFEILCLCRWLPIKQLVVCLRSQSEEASARTYSKNVVLLHSKLYVKEHRGVRLTTFKGESILSKSQLISLIEYVLHWIRIHQILDSIDYALSIQEYPRHRRNIWHWPCHGTEADIE